MKILCMHVVHCWLIIGRLYMLSGAHAHTHTNTHVFYYQRPNYAHGEDVLAREVIQQRKPDTMQKLLSINTHTHIRLKFHMCVCTQDNAHGILHMQACVCVNVQDTAHDILHMYACVCVKVCELSPQIHLPQEELVAEESLARPCA